MEMLARLAEICSGARTRMCSTTRRRVAQGAPRRPDPERRTHRRHERGRRALRCHDIFLPDVLGGAGHVRQHGEQAPLIRDGVPARGRVVLGTVQGDLHDIGKNLVAIMLRGAGYEVVDLGHNVAPAAFVDAAERADAR